MNQNAVGSGVIFSKEGHIVTNTHILTNARSVFVEFNDGEITEAILIGADKYSDIAVLKINGFEGLNPIESAESSNIRVGDEVLAIGNPFGVGKLLQVASLVQLEEIMETPIWNYFKLMQQLIQETLEVHC